MKEQLNLFHIQIRTKQLNLFKFRAEKFAFLNIWRTYLQQEHKICAYVLLPGRFECVIATNTYNETQVELLFGKISQILSNKMKGSWDESDVEQFCSAIRVAPLLTEKDCIYRIFDIHTLPQKIGITTDYRAYPYSSYQALASVQATQLAKVLVWQWFGGRMRFAAFHQAYAGWKRNDYAIV
jgi:hypothetical protein